MWMARQRILWLDIARTAALVCMILFHFVRDLEMFALIPPGTTLDGFWAIFARVIAGAFLFLAGVSLVLAHGDRFHAVAWARRFIFISGAASSISIVTYVAVPERWIFFGILHAIAAASVIGLIFLRSPAALTLAAGFGVWVVFTLHGRGLDLPNAFAFTGLAINVPPALDFIPLVPWLAPFLFGMAFAQWQNPVDLEPRWRRPPAKILTVPGQHSLLVYLLHQPVLIALVAAIAWVAG